MAGIDNHFGLNMKSDLEKKLDSEGYKFISNISIDKNVNILKEVKHFLKEFKVKYNEIKLDKPYDMDGRPIDDLTAVAVYVRN